MTDPTIPPTQKACANCAFFAPSSPHNLVWPLGECRADSPKAGAGWPLVRPEWWCGVWQRPDAARAD